MVPSTWHRVIVVGVAALSFSAAPSVHAETFGSWSPLYSTSADFKVCANSTDCANDYMIVNLQSLDEFSGTGDFSNSVADFRTSSVFTFNDNFVTTDSYSTVSGQRFVAAIPNDGVRPPYNPPATPGDGVFSYNVSQVVSGTVERLYDLNLWAPTNAMGIELSIRDWAFNDPAHMLRLIFSVYFLDDNVQPAETPMVLEYDAYVHRYMLSKSVYLDLPQVVLDANGVKSPALAKIFKNSGMYGLELHLPSGPFIKYGFIMNAGGPKISLPPAPSPTPAPPSNGLTPAATPAPVPAANVTFPTAVNTFPGGFEFCAAANCNIKDGTFSLALDKLGRGAFLDSDNNIVFGDVLTNFTASAKELVFVTPEFDDPSLLGSNKAKTLFLSVPKTSGQATRVNEWHYINAKNSEAIYMALTIEHLATAANLTGVNNYGGIAVPVGGARLAIEINVPPSMVTPFFMMSPALTFFISAFEHGKAVSNVTVETDIDTTSILLGDSMRLEFLTLAEIDGSTHPMTVAAKVHTSGEYEGLVQLSLLVSSLSSSFHCGAVISTDVLDSGNAGAENTTTWSPVVPSAVPGFEGVKTQLLALSHGEFGLCLDSTSCGKSSVKMGFSGLGATGSNGDSELGRFANAAAFEFRDPELVSAVIDGVNVTKWTTGFRAFVPQSQFRPPMPYDPSAPPSSQLLPEFAVQVDQYLIAGTSLNGNQKISVPSGGLKFAFNLTKWKFASTTDSLVLNITLANATGTGVIGDAIANAFTETKDFETGLSRTTVNVSSSVATIAEFPLLAVIDGVDRMIDISVSYDASIGVVVSMKFPYFVDSLFYDPVLSSSLLSDLPAPTPAPGIDINLRGKRAKSTKSDRTAMILLAFLAFVVVLSAMRCVKRVSIKKLDFSKIIP